MFYRVKELQYPAKPDRPDPAYARKLQEVLGGQWGEMSVMMTYLFQGWNCRGPAKYRDMIMDIATEEIAHVEMLATMIARLLEGAPTGLIDQAVDQHPALAAVIGGMNPQHAIVTGLGAAPTDSVGYPWNAKYTIASGNLLADFRFNVTAESQGRLQVCRLYNMTDDQGVRDLLSFMIARDTMHQNQWLAAIEELKADGLEVTPAPSSFPQKLENHEHNYSFWNCSEGTESQAGAWAKGQAPDGKGTFTYLARSSPSAAPPSRRRATAGCSSPAPRAASSTAARPRSRRAGGRDPPRIRADVNAGWPRPGPSGVDRPGPVAYRAGSGAEEGWTPGRPRPIKAEVGRLDPTQGGGACMRHRAVIAGTIAAFGLLAGCSAAGLRGSSGPDPETWARIQALSREAQAAIDAGDLERGRLVLLRLLAEDPDSSEAQRRLGGVLQAQGRLGPAEAAYRRALELDPDYIDARIGLGEVEALLGRPAEALPHFDAAIEVSPQRAAAHLGQGKALEALGRTDEALAAYYRGLERDPDSADSLRRVAAIQLGRERPEQALAGLDQALELAPDDAESHLLRGRALLVLDRPDEARTDLRLAAESLPDRPDAFYLLALALEKSREPAAALEAADRAVQLAPDFAAAQDLSQRLRR